MNPIVVMPSIRPVNWEFYEPLASVPFMIVDDSYGAVDRTQNQPPSHFTYAGFADRDFVEKYIPAGNGWLFPQHNPSCKNFGLYYAWHEGYDTVLLIDDDVDVSCNPDYLAQVPIGKTLSAREVVTPYNWWNPMIQLGREDFFSRGFPYEYRHVPPKVGQLSTFVTSRFNEGLWWGTPDINGADKINHETSEYENRIGSPCFPDYVTIETGTYVPISIMNIQIENALLPAFWQPPDFQVSKDWKIRRHDDVWSGIFLQALMHRRGDAMTVGQPLALHTRPGNLMGEIKSEVNTNQIQSYLAGLIRQAACDVVPADYATMAQDLCDRALSLLGSKMYAPGAFFRILAEYLQGASAWAKLLKAH